MSFDLIIKNGTVILENEARIVDIAVQAGKITAIGEKPWGQSRSWMRRVWWFHRAWLMRIPISLSRAVRTGKAMRPERVPRQKGGITTMIEMPLNQMPATVGS